MHIKTETSSTLGITLAAAFSWPLGVIFHAVGVLVAVLLSAPFGFNQEWARDFFWAIYPVVTLATAYVSMILTGLLLFRDYPDEQEE